MDISLLCGPASIILNGTGMGVPVKATRLTVPVGSPLCLEVSLDGTVAQVTNWIETTDLVLSMAAAGYGLPGEDWGYLRVTVNGETWQTVIKRGWVEFPTAGRTSSGPAARAVGSQGLLIWLDREDFWEAISLTYVPLTNMNGTDVTGGLDCDNHSDAADSNYAQIGIAAIGGSLPAPAWLRLSNSVNGSTFYVGQAVTSDVTVNCVLEAENGTLGAGVSGASTGDAACSNGNYRPLSWTGTGVVNLLYWDLGATVTKQFRGRTFRPVLRLRDLISGSEKFWLWWRVGFNVAGTIETIQDFEGVLCSTSEKLVLCPPMPVPPWPKTDGAWAWESATLCLMCQAEAAGSHAINLDFVQVMPTEGWLRFVPIVSTITNSQVTLDQGTGMISRTSTAMASHAVDGSGIWLSPIVAQTLFVLSGAGSSMSISTLNQLRVGYRKRKKVL